jgi:sialate O-acetylesterase
MRYSACQIVVLLLMAAITCTAEPTRPLLATVFGDHAVLQRDRAVALWGWGRAGSSVGVRLQGGDLVAPLTATATVAADGRWLARLPAHPAGGPYELVVSDGPDSITLKDILLGDVWLCSGQSNMEFQVNGAKDAAAEKAAATFPMIRQLAMPRLIAGEPQATASAKWVVCTPDSVGMFTAVGFFFGRRLHQDLAVPIGLVNSSYGGTKAECWTSAEALAVLPPYADAATRFHTLYAAFREQSVTTGKDYDTLVRAWYRENDPGSAGEVAAWADPTLDMSNGWSEVQLPAKLKQDKAVPADFTGTIWLRRDVDVPEGAAGKPGMLNLIRVKDMNAAWINGVSIGDSESVNWLRKQRVPATLLKPGRNTVAIRLVCLEGECGLTGRPEDLMLTPEGQQPLPLAGTWKVRLGTSFAAAKPMPVRFDRVTGATSLYNGMIAPLLPMTLAGAIWYQGESDTSTAFHYRTLLPAMIRDWRSRFGQDDLPFLIVQLANHMGRGTRPETSAWAEMREAQAMTARDVPGCGLAVAIDVGEANDIHPKNKQEVGRRLALVAEAQVHHMPVACSGPRYRSLAEDGTAIRLVMDEAQGLTTSDGKDPIGFAIAGKDRRFVWATARIDGTTLVVSASEVAEPVAVRYAWGNNPACNLTNASGLPASPFRTDDWPGVTAPK